MMNSLTTVFMTMAPAVGGIGIWVVWKLSHDWLNDREEQRRERRAPRALSDRHDDTPRPH